MIILIIIVALVVGGFWAARGVQDMIDNPAVMIGRAIALANPEISLEEVDRERQRITFRYRETGELFTVDFEDVEEGRIRFEREDGTVLVFGHEE